MDEWNGKNKAVTFSFDDGITQDIRLIEIFNKYNLKCTFNLNSGLLGGKTTLVRNGRTVDHNKIDEKDVKFVYEGHEVAAHGAKHCNLTMLNRDQIIREVEGDRLKLSDLCGYEVYGMAYAGGNVDERVENIIKNDTGIKYARRVGSTKKFIPQKEHLLLYDPTIYIIEEDFEDVVDKFLALNTNEPSLLYIWGHAFEMDAEYISWEKFERICKKLAFHEDIYYGTNREVLKI